MSAIPGTRLKHGFDLGPEHDHMLAEVYLLPQFQKEGAVAIMEANGHYQGSLLHENSRPGRPVHVVPLTNELVRIDQVTKSLGDEEAKLSGYVDSDGQHIPGELDHLDKVRGLLLGWMSRDEDDLVWARSFLGSVSGSRIRATGETNQKIAAVASGAQSLKDSLGRDNPGAMLAKTWVLREAFRQRYTQVVRNMDVHAQRSSRTLHWMFEESRRLGELYETATAMQSSPSESRYGHFLHMLGNIHFTAPLVNRFKQLTAPFGSRIPDAEIFEDFKRGVIFNREKNYLVTPVRILGAQTLGALKERSTEERAADQQAITDRIHRWEELDLQGPYNDLRSAVIPGLEEVKEAIRQKNPKGIKHTCQKVGQLTIYQCSPESGDGLLKAFYRSRPPYAQSA